MVRVAGENRAAGDGYRLLRPGGSAVKISVHSRAQVVNRPGMNRRDFLVRSSLFTTAGLFARAKLEGAENAAAPAPAAKAPMSLPAPAATEFKPLRRDVGLFTGRGGSIGWLANKDGLAVVDTQFPRRPRSASAGLPAGPGARSTS